MEETLDMEDPAATADRAVPVLEPMRIALLIRSNPLLLELGAITFATVADAEA